MPGAISQLAALVVYAGTPARASQMAAMVPYSYIAGQVRETQTAALVPYTTAARSVRAAQLAALVVYSANPYNVPRVSQEAAMVVWGTTPPGAEARTRAWTFVMDGHQFYVLDLGEEGTFLFDLATQQWCQFRTQGYIGWNMRAGTVWQTPNRIVAGDTLYGQVWEMSPADIVDESFRPIEHIATGGLMLRSRVYVAVESVRIAGSIGAVQDDLPGVTTRMKFSDDGGNTWSDEYVVELIEGEFDGEIAYRSLGSFMAPGRVFEFVDEGGIFRIDGVDVMLEDFDEDDGGA